MAVVVRPQWAAQGSFWDTQAAASPFHCPVGPVWWSQGPVEFRNSFSQSQLSASIGTFFFVRSKGFASLWSTHRANKKHRPTTKLSGRSVLRLWAYLSGQYRALWAFRDTARIRNTRFLAVWRKRSILNLRGVLWLWLRDPNGRRREVFGIPKLPPVHSIARWGLCGGHRGLWSSGIPFLVPRGPILVVLEPPAPPPAPGTQGRAFTRDGPRPPQGCPGAPPDRRGWPVGRPGGPQDDSGGGSARWRPKPLCFGGQFLAASGPWRVGRPERWAPEGPAPAGGHVGVRRARGGGGPARWRAGGAGCWERRDSGMRKWACSGIRPRALTSGAFSATALPWAPTGTAQRRAPVGVRRARGGRVGRRESPIRSCFPRGFGCLFGRKGRLQNHISVGSGILRGTRGVWVAD